MSLNDFIQLTSLKRFQLTDVTLDFTNFIDEGAQGGVYKHIQDNQEYAIKIIDPESWEDEEEFYKDALWQTEIIHHINGNQKCIHFYGYDILDNKIIFIMELLNQSDDLSNYIERFLCNGVINDYIAEQNSGRNKNISEYFTLDRDIKLKIIYDIMVSICEVHEKGIIHCDIKPPNIICYNIEGKVNTKLIDFGASLFSDENSTLIETDFKHGTLGYSSPEDYQQYLIGKPSDIYSFGVTAIEIWCGDIWKSDDETFKSCRNEVLKMLRNIEKEELIIGTLLRKCICMDPYQRPTIQQLIKCFKDLKGIPN